MKHAWLWFGACLSPLGIIASAADAAGGSAATPPVKLPGDQQTKGVSCLQVNASRVKKATAERDLEHHSGAKGNSSAQVVAITYCDATFASIWPTFVKCYEQALGCSLIGQGEGRCGPSKPRLIDLALEHLEPGEPAVHCMRKHAPKIALSEQSTEASAALTPKAVPLLIAMSIAKQLALGHDVLRLDADAFLLADPMQTLRKEFPDVDMIGSPDCARDGAGYCNWYKDRRFTKRHRGKDPLKKVGFMLNTGLMYIRSTPQTIALARATVKAIQSGKSTFEQTAFNEELARQRCRWSVPLKGDRRSPGGVHAFRLLQKTRLLGKCRGGLRVVALPYAKLTRTLSVAQGGGAAAMHPGGVRSEKIAMLPKIGALCDKFSAS